MRKKTKIQKIIESLVRNNRKEQGFYDGRYREKVVPDKKKKYVRKKIRKSELDKEE
jgi:ATP-dependent protease HslVU (ClpYQ) ATPase subunit